MLVFSFSPPNSSPVLVHTHIQLFHSWTPARCNFALNTVSSAFSRVATVFTISFLNGWAAASQNSGAGRLGCFRFPAVRYNAGILFKELFHCLRIIPLGHILRCGIAGLKVMNFCVALERELSPGFALSLQTAGTWGLRESWGSGRASLRSLG